MSTENITANVIENTDTQTNTTSTNTTTTPTPQQQQFDPTKIVVTDENTALNGLVTFLNVAQRRGVFTFAEAAKCNECIQRFVRDGPPPTQ